MSVYTRVDLMVNIDNFGQLKCFVYNLLVNSISVNDSRSNSKIQLIEELLVLIAMWIENSEDNLKNNQQFLVDLIGLVGCRPSCFKCTFLIVLLTNNFKTLFNLLVDKLPLHVIIDSLTVLMDVGNLDINEETSVLISNMERHFRNTEIYSSNTMDQIRMFQLKFHNQLTGLDIDRMN